MSFTITDSSAIQALADAYASQNWQETYRIIFEALSDKTQTTEIDPETGVAITSPSYTKKEGVDEAVYVWIAGAKNVNANSGQFASYIRGYTAMQ